MTAIPVKRKMKVKRRMGLFYVDCEVENIRQRDKKATVSNLLVDTGSRNTWLPADVLRKLGVEVFKKDEPFVPANGTTVMRPMGYAILRVADFLTVDEVVFAQPRDLSLLGAKTLQGFGAIVDPKNERLLGAGPAPAAPVSKKWRTKA